MDAFAADRIKHLSNTEVVRRLLIRYFIDKGFNESFDRHVYPGVLTDLTSVIPTLASKLEIIPHAESIDNSIGKARLGWNLFVLGTHRMYLGETFHNDLHALARGIRSGVVPIPEDTYSTARRQTTPKRIITFITRVLGEHDDGFVDLSPSKNPTKPGEMFQAKQTMMGMPQQFFSRSGYGT